MNYILEAKNLHVYYGAIQALRGVDIVVPEGKIVAILGSNGAGKTTFLKAVSGIVTPKEGNVLFNGHDITKYPVEKITENGISHVPEGRQIFGDLTVYENLKIGGFTVKKTALRWNDIEEEAKTKRVKAQYETQKAHDKNPLITLNKSDMFMQNLAKVYQTFPVLKERKNQTASTLSGGEMQMLAIARGLMGTPSLLILDEPSLGLAPLIVKDIFAIIQKLNRSGLSVLIVEQNALQTLKIADYAYVLQIGKVVKEGKAKEMMKDQELIEAYLGS